VSTINDILFAVTASATETATTNTSPVITTPTQASTEFAILMSKLIKELQQNEDDNLEAIKSICCFLTIGSNPGILLFNDDQRKAIEACSKLVILFRGTLRNCWKWNNITTLKMIIQSLGADTCMALIDQYEKKIDARMRLKDILEYYEKENLTPSEECHKMVAIVKDKIFSTITKEEYDELRQFTSKQCGVEPYVISLSKVLAYDSILIEWFIPVTAMSYMVEMAKQNVDSFAKATFLYLKISSTVIFDYRSNVSFQ